MDLQVAAIGTVEKQVLIKQLKSRRRQQKTMKNNSGRLSLRKRLGLEIALKIRNNLRELHPLRQLFWECTLQCNLACKHCGSDCRKMSEQKGYVCSGFSSSRRFDYAARQS